MERILITGGSGFVGTHLIKRLLATRPDAEIHNLDLRPSPLPVTNHVAPLEQAGSYLDIPPVDAIVHLAAVSREPGFPTRRYYEVNTFGTSVLAEWAAKVDVPKIVFYSSISVYGPAEEPTDEDAMKAPESPYGMSKLLGERELRLWHEREDTSLAVIRPGVIFGEGDDGNFPRLAKAVRQGWFAFPGRADTRKAAIYVNDVVEFTDWLLDHDFDELTTNAVYSEASTTADIVAYMAAAMGTRTRTVVVPEGLARFGVGVLGVAEAHKPPVERMFHQRRIDKLISSSNIVSRSLPELSFEFSHTMETALHYWLTGAPSQPVKNQSS